MGKDIKRRLLAVALSGMTAFSAAPAFAVPYSSTQLANGHPVESTLPNGLRVLLLEDHSFPLVASFVWYHSGSRNEPAGLTGVSHVLEHLLFRNIGPFTNGSLSSTLARNGIQFNGYTSEDFTTFYELLHPSKLELAIKAEAARMRSATFVAADLKSEVNRVEQELGEEAQDPATSLTREVRATAFHQHPYGNPVTGWRSDLESLSVSDLKYYYDRNYHPNNATLILVGDFTSDSAKQLINKYFGSVPKSATPVPVVRAVESTQTAERRVLMKYPGKREFAYIAYHGPKYSDPDAPATVVLEKLLNAHFNGRIKAKLLETKTCSGAHSAFELRKDPGLFTASLTASNGVPLPRVIDAWDAMIAQVRSQPVSDAELRRARNQAEFALLSDRDGPYKTAFQLGFCDSMQSWQSAYDWIERLRSVTAADVSRAAKRYLSTDNRVVGLLSSTAPPPKQQSQPIAGAKNPVALSPESQNKSEMHFGHTTTWCYKKSADGIAKSNTDERKLVAQLDMEGVSQSAIDTPNRAVTDDDENAQPVKRTSRSRSGSSAVSSDSLKPRKKVEQPKEDDRTKTSAPQTPPETSASPGKAQSSEVSAPASAPVVPVSAPVSAPVVPAPAPSSSFPTSSPAQSTSSSTPAAAADTNQASITAPSTTPAATSNTTTPDAKNDQPTSTTTSSPASLTSTTVSPTQTTSAQPVVSSPAALSTVKASSGATSRPAQSFKEFRLRNGVRLIVFESHLSPVVQIMGMIKAGEVFEPAGKPGLSELLASCYNNGSTKLSKLQLQTQQEDMGLTPDAMLRFRADLENISFHSRCLSRDLQKQLSALNSIIRDPALTDSDLDHAKQDCNWLLKHADESLDHRVERAFYRSVLAPTSGFYPRDPSDMIKTVAQLKSSDIKDYLMQSVAPDDTTLVLAGDVDPDVAARLVEIAFEGWTHSVSFKGKPAPEAQPNPRHVVKSFVPMHDQNKDFLCLGKLVPINMKDERFSYLLISDCALLSHPLIARLTKSFNQEPSLAQSLTDEDMEARMTQLGSSTAWSISLPVEPSAVPRAAALFQNELRQFQRIGITSSELSEAKRYLTNALPVKQVSSDQQAASYCLDALLGGAGANYLETQIFDIQNASVDAVNRFLRNEFRPEQATLVVAGNKQSSQAVHRASTIEPERKQVAEHHVQ